MVARAGHKSFKTYHICRFSARNRKLQIGIFLPVSKEQRELGEESIINASCCRDGLGIGIAVDASLKRLSGTDKVLPSLEVIGVVNL